MHWYARNGKWEDGKMEDPIQWCVRHTPIVRVCWLRRGNARDMAAFMEESQGYGWRGTDGRVLAPCVKKRRGAPIFPSGALVGYDFLCFFLYLLSATTIYLPSSLHLLTFYHLLTLLINYRQYGKRKRTPSLAVRDSKANMRKGSQSC